MRPLIGTKTTDDGQSRGASQIVTQIVLYTAAERAKIQYNMLAQDIEME